MSKLLFKLRNVPDDEAIEVRELLDANEIDYFETTPGNWGISMPGLWLSNADDFPRARALLDDYQTARTQRERARFDALRATGNAPTLWQFGVCCETSLWSLAFSLWPSCYSPIFLSASFLDFSFTAWLSCVINYSGS